MKYAALDRNIFRYINSDYGFFLIPYENVESYSTIDESSTSEIRLLLIYDIMVKGFDSICNHGVPVILSSLKSHEMYNIVPEYYASKTGKDGTYVLIPERYLSESTKAKFNLKYDRHMLTVT